MATYYWLGVTGGTAGVGNVNLPQNWSLWSPSGVSGATLPQSSTTIPKYLSDVVFTKYLINGDQYPKYSPIGIMQGICGPYSGTTFQYFNSVTVRAECPVSIGGTGEYFSVACKTYKHESGVTFSYINDTNYIEFLYTGLTLNSYNSASFKLFKGLTFYVKGTAKTIQSLSGFPSQIPQEKSRFYTNDLTIDDQLYVDDPDALPGDKPISLFFRGNSVVNVGPSCNVGIFRIYVAERGVLNIEKGFSANLITVQKLNEYTPIVNFIPELANGSDLSVTRTNIQYFEILRDTTSSGEGPIVNINHGVDIVNYYHIGGIVNFNQDPTADSVVIQKGLHDCRFSTTTAQNLTASIGVNGDFIVYGDEQFQPYGYENNIKFALNGTWKYKLTSKPGYTGHQF
jgi:hypothetical protein